MPDPSWAYHGPTASRFIGFTLAGGDLNGDGIPDVAAGTESGGRAYVFYGNTVAVAIADAIAVAEGGTATALVGGANSNEVEVTITMAPLNDPPVISSGAGSAATEDTVHVLRGGDGSPSAVGAPEAPPSRC